MKKTLLRRYGPVIAILVSLLVLGWAAYSNPEFIPPDALTMHFNK